MIAPRRHDFFLNSRPATRQFPNGLPDHRSEFRAGSLDRVAGARHDGDPVYALAEAENAPRNHEAEQRLRRSADWREA